MRSRAGPGGALILIAVISLALGSLTGCRTVARVGHVLEAAGDTIGAIGGVLVDGAAADLKSGTDAVGITAPAPAPGPVVAPAKEAPAAPDASPQPPSSAIPIEEDLVALPSPSACLSRAWNSYRSTVRFDQPPYFGLLPLGFRRRV